MKKTLKKLLICILIILIINNFFMSNISLAANGFEEALSDLLGSVVGILSWIPRMFALGVGYAVNTLTAAVAYSQGSIDDDGNILPDTFFNNAMITPFDIFFNKVALLDVNFFNIPNDGTVISNIRTSIAAWYYVMRNVASAILLCVLVYVGIRMAISTVASDKAAYKKMLVDWVCSLALIFLLHYIIIFTFAVNEAFIKGLSNVANGKELSDAVVLISTEALGVDVNAIGATIVFCMLVFQTLGLVITYINRMLKIAFLIIIAPLITLTYSIDKIGDGKAQALGTWLKEFVYTVLIQVFHCVIYMAFISMAFSIFTNASDENNLAGAILAMLCIKFTKDAEKILGKIFKFSDSTSDTSIGVGLAATAMALGHAKNIGKTTRSAINGVRNMKGRMDGAARNAKIEAMALGAMLSGATREDGSKKSFAEAKEEATTKVLDKEADKLETKNAKKYGVIADKNDEKLKDKINANMQQGMSKSLATATARAQLAKETRKTKKAEKFAEKHKVLNGAKGTIKNLKEAAGQSETLKLLGDMGKKSMSAGMGLAVGSFAYSNSNALQAIMAGTAMYKGHQEFMNSSTKTLSNEVSELLGGAGIKDAADAGAKMDNIMQNADKFENEKDTLDDIYKEIESALGGLSSQEKKCIKSQLKNVVDTELKRNPSATNQDIYDSITKSKDKNGQSTQLAKIFSAKPEGFKALETMSDFRRDKAIYSNIKTATDIGLSPDVFVADSIKAFDSSTHSNTYVPGPTRDEITATREHNEEIREENEKIIKDVSDGNDINPKDIVNEREREEIIELEKRMQEEIKELEYLKNENERYGNDTSEMEAQISALEENMNKLAEKSIETYKKELDDQLNKYREQLKNEADMQVKIQLQAAMQGLLPQYKSLVTEAKKFGSAKTIEDAKEMYIKTKKEVKNKKDDDGED